MKKKGYAENDKIWKIMIGKNGHFAKATQNGLRQVSLRLKLKVEKITKNESRTTLELFYAKNRSKKHLLLEN